MELTSLVRQEGSEGAMVPKGGEGRSGQGAGKEGLTVYSPPPVREASVEGIGEAEEEGVQWQRMV